MTVLELVKKYRITISPNNRDNLAIYGRPSDDALAEIKERKSEILAFLNEEREIQERRRANDEKIEGLKELNEAIDAWNRWHAELEESFEGPEAVGGMGVGPRPENPNEVMKRYPQASAYSELRKAIGSENIELYSIAKKAMDRFLDNPDDWVAVMREYEEERKAFIEKHLWD